MIEAVFQAKFQLVIGAKDVFDLHWDSLHSCSELSVAVCDEDDFLAGFVLKAGNFVEDFGEPLANFDRSFSARPNFETQGEVRKMKAGCQKMNGDIYELLRVASLPEVCGEADSVQMRQVLGEVLVHSSLDVVVDEWKLSFRVSRGVLQEALRKHPFDKEFGSFAANPLEGRTIQNHCQRDEHVELLLGLVLWRQHGKRLDRSLFGR